MIVSNLPINDDIAKKLSYKNDGGATVEINAKDVATTDYVDSNYLPLDGSKPMTGENLWLNNKYGLVFSGENKSLLESINSNENTDNCRGIAVLNSDGESDLDNAVRFYERKDGVLTRYKLYGEHNAKLDIKAYTSLESLGLTFEAFDSMDYNTAINAVFNSMPDSSVLTIGLKHSAEEPNSLCSLLVDKINSDCHMSYNQSTLQFSAKFSKWHNSFMPCILEVIMDYDCNKYECIYEYDGETLNISKFTRTYAPLGVSSSIPLSNLDLNEVGIHTGYEGVYYGTSNNNCTNYPPVLTKSVAFSLTVERGGGDLYWCTQTYTGTQSGRVFKRSRSGQNRWTEWKEVSTVPITYGTTDLVSGVSELPTGTIYLVYEE